MARAFVAWELKLLKVLTPQEYRDNVKKDFSSLFIYFIYLFCLTHLKGEIHTIHTNTRHTTTKMRKLKDAGDCTLQTKA